MTAPDAARFESGARCARRGRAGRERPYIYTFWGRKLARLLPGGGVIIDVGCGGGRFLPWPAAPLAAVGLDISAEALRAARAGGGGRLIRGDAGRLPVKDASCAAVVAFDVVEHLQRPEDFLDEARRVLPPEGLLVLRTPNPSSLGARLKPRGTGRPLLAPAAHTWFGWRDKTHVTIRPREAWLSALADTGFAVQQTGTDTLWDVPYARGVPLFLQKLIFLSAHRVLSRLFGFLPWRLGENFVCIARKAAPA